MIAGGVSCGRAGTILFPGSSKFRSWGGPIVPWVGGGAASESAGAGASWASAAPGTRSATSGSNRMPD